jgi:exopolyphosphatase/guanosine-5'-triphosphate,3'-diphosphate pyrophosphatase
VRYASIDIGTNSVLLLIGEPLPDGRVQVVEDRATVTRLGQGLAETGVIADEAADRTLKALGIYWQLCIKHGVSGIAAVGTAALRNAKNVADFLLVVRRELGLDIEVISAEREARLTYQASEHDFGPDIVVIDIGGGSTEIICRRPRVKDALDIQSLTLGCVSLTEAICQSDPVTDQEYVALCTEIRSELEKSIGREIYSPQEGRQLVATAGTATTLMAIKLGLEPYVSDRVHGQDLTIEELKNIIDDLKSKTIEERKRIPGLIPERAQVIFAGAVLLDQAMSFLGYSQAIISDRGVKWGYFYEKFCRS